MESAPKAFFDILTAGGPLGIAIVLILFVLSVIALYIFIERYLTIKKASRVDQNFMNNIRANVSAGNIPGAKALCQTTDSPVARMVEKGLQRIGKPLRDIDAAIENVGNLEIFRLEKNLSTLASIAGAAPMIGFFGTVTGMILAFYKMATEQNVTPDVLAGGIYQALITTATGLIHRDPWLLSDTTSWWQTWKRSFSKWNALPWSSWTFCRSRPIDDSESGFRKILLDTINNIVGLKKRNKVSAEFSMSSLTDIIFLLLIFFMLTSTLVKIQPFDLPKSDSKTVASTSVVVTVDKGGKHTLNNEDHS